MLFITVLLIKKACNCVFSDFALKVKKGTVWTLKVESQSPAEQPKGSGAEGGGIEVN